MIEPESISESVSGVESEMSSERGVDHQPNAQLVNPSDMRLEQDADRNQGIRALLPDHWLDYLLEGAELGIFMILAGALTTLFEWPGSPLHQAFPNSLLRRMLIGILMGLTAVSIIYSPWGKRTGAHFNPAVTLTFYRLGKLQRIDAIGYVLAQCIGGISGITVVALVLRERFTDLPVRYIVTLPGSLGWFVAFWVEFGLAFVLMTMVLFVSNTRNLSQYTGWFAGTLVATFITLAAPFSGMSINPARTLASAVPAAVWESLWIYFLAPPLAMLFAAEVYLKIRGRVRPICGKLCPNMETQCLCQNCCLCTHVNLPSDPHLSGVDGEEKS